MIRPHTSLWEVAQCNLRDTREQRTTVLERNPKKANKRAGNSTKTIKTMHNTYLDRCAEPPLYHLPPDTVCHPNHKLVLTKHASKNTPSSLPSNRHTQRRKSGGGTFFFSTKESNHKILWIYLLLDAKDTQQHIITFFNLHFLNWLDK